MRQLLILSFLFVSNLFLGAQDSFTLQEAIDYALKNHPSKLDDELDRKDAYHQYKEVLATGFPQIKASAGYQHFIKLPTSIIQKGSFFEGDPQNNIPPNPIEDLEVQFGVKNAVSAGFDMQTLIFDGSFLVGVEAAREYKSFIEYQNSITDRDIRLAVTKAYLQQLIAEENMGILQSNIDNLDNSLGDTKALYENGFVEKLDIDRLEYSKSKLGIEKGKIGRLAETAMNFLKFQMGYPIDKEISLSQKMDEFVLDDAADVALLSEVSNLDTRPEIQALNRAEALRKLDVKQLRYGYLPTVGAFGNFSYQLQTEDFKNPKWFPNSAVGLNISVPVFDFNNRKHKIERAKVRLEKHRLTISETKRGMMLEVDQARTEFSNALQEVKTTKESLDLAQEIYDVSKIKYTEGVGSSLELSQAERDVYSSQATYLQALYQYLVAKVNLEKSIGKI